MGSPSLAAFTHTTFVVQAGTLAQFVKTTLGLTDAQLAAIIANARSVTEQVMGSVIAASFGNSYPADPRSGAGVRFTKLGLTFRVQLDYTTIAFSPIAPTAGLLVAQNSDGQFTAFNISALPVSPQLIATLLTGPVPDGYPPRRGQFLAALDASSPGRRAALRYAVPSNPSDPINRAWEDTLFIAVDGILAQFAKTLFSLSADDLNTILRQARLRSE